VSCCVCKGEYCCQCVASGVGWDRGGAVVWEEIVNLCRCVRWDPHRTDVVV
jgi:hypothetical protein